MNQKEETIPVNSPTPAQQEAKKAFSRFALCIVLPFLAANIISLILGSVVSYMAQAGSLSESLASSTTFCIIISAAPILVLFYPVAYLLTKKMPTALQEVGLFLKATRDPKYITP